MERLKPRLACGLVCLAAQLALALCARAQQPIVFHGVPSNAAVNCLSDLPGGLLTALDAVPYGVPSNVVSGLAIGDTFYLQPWPLYPGGGSIWGPIEACGILIGKPSIIHAIVSGCEVSSGEIVNVATGFDGVKDGFQERYYEGKTITVLPVTDLFPDSNHNITIRGLIVAQMLEPGSGAGSNWRLQMQLLSPPPSFSTVTATSTCSGAVTVAFSETRSNLTSNCNTVILRTWTATDLCTNTLSATQTITVSNTLPLSISCPSNVLVAADAGQGTASHVNLGVAMAIDSCSVSQPGTSNAPDAFPVGVNQVIWAAGCAACTQKVIVVNAASFGIASIAPQSNDLRLTWTMPLGVTGFVQTTFGDVDGDFSNAFSNVGAPVFQPGTGTITTDYLDAGALTNAPSRFYRLRLVP